MNIFSPRWWSKLSSKPRRRAVANRRRVRLELELLEGRTLLSSDLFSSVMFDILPPDPGPEERMAAAPVALSATAAAFRTGSIEAAQNADLFQFVAPLTTRMVIRQTAAFDSQLDSFLSIFDDTGALIARSDNTTPNTPHSQVQFDVVEGRTYYAEAAGFSEFVEGELVSSLGDYALTFSSFADPQIVALDTSGSASVTGAIGAAGDVDLFQFVAAATGLTVVSQERTARSSLDSTLAAYDSSGELLAFNDDADDRDRDSRTGFLVEAGETYFVQSAGYASSAGDYVLTLTTTAAETINLGSGLLGQSALVPSTISEPGEVDLFAFAVLGQVNVAFVSLIVADALNPGVTLAVFDSNLLAVGGDFLEVGADSPSPLDRGFSATRGQIFIVAVAGTAGPQEYALAILALFFDTEDRREAGGARPATAAKSALPEQPPLVVLPSPIVIPTMPAAPRAAGGQNASIAPLGFGGNDASLVLVTTLLADPRASGAISPPAALGAASDPAAPLTVYAISTPADASAVPDAVLVAALHQVLNDSLGSANRVAQAGWLLADDTLAVLTNTVSPVGQALRSVVGDDAEILETLGREIGDNLRHATWAIGGSLAAATRSLLDRQSRSAPAGPAPLPMPAQQQPEPSVPDELNPDELPDTEPQEKIALSALFITAGLTSRHRPRRCRDRRGLAVKSQRTK